MAPRDPPVKLRRAVAFKKFIGELAPNERSDKLPKVKQRNRDGEQRAHGSQEYNTADVSCNEQCC